VKAVRRLFDRLQLLNLLFFLFFLFLLLLFLFLLFFLALSFLHDVFLCRYRPQTTVPRELTERRATSPSALG
jgi:uncharacterized protein (DUF58 family)